MLRKQSPTLGVLIQPFIASEDMPAPVATKYKVHAHGFLLDFTTTASLPLNTFEVDLNVFALDSSDTSRRKSCADPLLQSTHGASDHACSLESFHNYSTRGTEVPASSIATNDVSTHDLRRLSRSMIMVPEDRLRSPGI
jgi:hypothetical protein